MDFKRPAAATSLVAVPAKRPRNDALTGYNYANGGALSTNHRTSGPQRTSSLDAPIMLLTGHEGEILCGKFSPDGSFLATAGHDRSIFLWSTYGECENLCVLSGHGGTILDLKFNADGDIIYTAATDKTVALWDVETGQRLKKIKGHTALVSSVDVARRGRQLVCSGSDDGTVRLWDRRQRAEVHCFAARFAVTSVCFGEAADQIYSAGIDNVVKVWDLRKMEAAARLQGHADTVTGLALSPDGAYLLSNGMDSTLRIWDVRPFAPAERCLKVLTGHQHTFEKQLLRCAWSPDGRRVSAGSGDRFVYVWDTASRAVLYKLPGHVGSVNETAFHPAEPILLSAGSDKQIYLGELEP